MQVLDTLEIYPRRLKAVNTAKGASTLCWIRGVNNFVIKKLELIFNKVGKNLKMFLLSLLELLCVDWQEKYSFFQYLIQLKTQ